MPREIPLTQGYVAIADDADYEELSKLSWYADVHRKTGVVYAARAAKRQRADGKTTFYRLKMHNVIMGEKEGYKVDHISRDSLDNRRSNLRWATRQQNIFNRKFKSKTGFTGVSISSCNRFIAAIQVDHKSRHIGVYSTAEEAARARDEVAKKLHGEFAYLNFPNN